MGRELSTARPALSSPLPSMFKAFPNLLYFLNVKFFPIFFTSLPSCNSFTLNSFADPHPLNPVFSILYKKVGEGDIPTLSGRTSAIFCFPYTLPSSVCCNSFVCHSYENCRGVYQQFPFWVPRAVCAKGSSRLLAPIAVPSSTFQPANLPTFKRFSAPPGFCYSEN